MASRSMGSLVAALLFIASTVVASPISSVQPRDYALKSSRPTPRKWKRQGSAPLDHRLQLQIGLRQSQIDDLIGHLDAGMLEASHKPFENMILTMCSVRSEACSLWTTSYGRGGT